MTLDELIESIAFSEVGTSKLFVETPRDPNAFYELTAKNRAALISHINDALMAICTKLPIFNYAVVIRLVAGKTTYELDSKHSIRNYEGIPDLEYPPSIGGDDAEYYIWDTDEEPFEDNVLLVTSVESESGMYNMTLNDASKRNAVYTPRPNVVQIPEDMIDNDEFINLSYQAHIVRVPIGTQAGGDYTIPLPYSLSEAVAAFIAHKLQLQPQSTENTSIAISHMERFDEICQLYSSKNIHNISGDVSNKQFTKRGWK